MSTEQQQPDERLSAEQRAAFWEREAAMWRNRALQARKELEERDAALDEAKKLIGEDRLKKQEELFRAKIHQLTSERDKLAEALSQILELRAWARASNDALVFFRTLEDIESVARAARAALSKRK